MSGVKTYRKLLNSSVNIDIAQAAKLLAGLPTPASQEYVWNSSRGDPRALTGLARRARPARLREGTLLKIHATLCEPFPRVAPIFNSPPSQSQTGPASRGDPRDLNRVTSQSQTGPGSRGSSQSQTGPASRGDPGATLPRSVRRPCRPALALTILLS